MESISEKHGIELVNENDLKIYSIGISTAGRAEIEMLKRNPNATIIATTIDEQGLEYTKEIINQNNLQDKIQLKLEDITTKLEYEDCTFDYVYARLVLHYLDNENLRKALKEIYRILKPNGKLYIVVRTNDDWEAIQEGTSYNEKTGITKYPVKGGYCYRRLHSKETIKNFLEEANFQITTIQKYEELLSKDYHRNDMNIKPSGIIEVIAHKQKPTRNAVRVFIQKENQIVAIQYKEGPIGYLDLPGGKIEENETPEQAAIREVKEETGLMINHLEKVGTVIEEYPDKIFHFQVFVTNDFEGTPKDFKENTSFWIPILELTKQSKRFGITSLLEPSYKTDIQNKTLNFKINVAMNHDIINIERM